MKLQVLLIISVLAHFTIAQVTVADDVDELRPSGGTEYRVVGLLDEGGGSVGVSEQGRRRRLAPYELCLLCKCCAGGNNNTAATCLMMPCCFGIDCQLPNKPFGVCAFLPKTCNCTSCSP